MYFFAFWEILFYEEHQSWLLHRQKNPHNSFVNRKHQTPRSKTDVKILKFDYFVLRMTNDVFNNKLILKFKIEQKVNYNRQIQIIKFLTWHMFQFHNSDSLRKDLRHISRTFLNSGSSFNYILSTCFCSLLLYVLFSLLFFNF